MMVHAIPGGRCRKAENQFREKSLMPAGNCSEVNRLICTVPEEQIEGFTQQDRWLTSILQTDLSLLRIRYGINDRLPPDICILNVENADPSFHARHDAVARSYIYQISRRRTSFGKKYVWWIKDQLDINKMNDTARHFTGLKNYKSFTDDNQEQNSTKVEIKHASVVDFGDMLVFHVVGSHFLWKQVRRMTGVLVESGRGKLDPRRCGFILQEQVGYSGKTYSTSKRTFP